MLARLHTVDRYPPDKGRGTSTYWRTMDRGNSALRFKVRNDSDLTMLVQAIKEVGCEPKRGPESGE